jgi:voltage-gated potassium channel
MSGRLYDDLPPAARRGLIIRGLVRPALSMTALLLLYYLLPLGDNLTGSTVVTLFAALVLVAALLTWQVRNIRTAKYPALRAIESVAISLPLFILVFAAVYFVTAHHVPASFSEGLSRTDALYLAVTVFSSVGFGDISPITEGARVVVMIQMIGDLLMVGIVARVVLGAVQSGLRRQEPGSQPG